MGEFSRLSGSRAYSAECTFETSIQGNEHARELFRLPETNATQTRIMKSIPPVQEECINADKAPAFGTRNPPSRECRSEDRPILLLIDVEAVE